MIKKQRKQIRLKNYNYSQPGWYYVTICTNNRECLFGEIINRKMFLNDVGKIIDKIIQYLPTRYKKIDLGVYQIMPNHIHFIIVINPTPVGAIHESPKMIHESADVGANNTQRAHRDTPLPEKRKLLPKCVGYLKMNSSKQINQLKNTPGQPVWQRNFYEYIIRNQAELGKIQEYIKLNPAIWDRDRNNPDLGKGKR